MTALYLAFLVAGAFAIWQIAVFVKSRLAGSPPVAGPTTLAVGPTSQPRWEPPGPAEMLAAPLAAAGLTEMSSDPANVPAPAGARRLDAFQRIYTGQVEQKARYELPGSADQAAEHYKRKLKDAGFDLLKDTAQLTGERKLVFFKGRWHAVVTLRKNARRAKIVDIILTVAGPLSAEGQP